MNILVVGGTFDENGGKPSGFITKFAKAIGTNIVYNGGGIEDLQTHINFVFLDYVFWMADIPNTFPKALPNLLAQNPRAILIQSKNNREGKYSHDELFDRMHKSGAEFLLEFTNGKDGKILTTILSIQRTIIQEPTDDIQAVANCLINEFARIGGLLFPVKSSTNEIPVGEHAGAFGVERKMHIHEGVDLYTKKYEVVRAMEDGEVVARQYFTGQHVDSPWWNDTYCVMVEGASGVINYGEILPRGLVIGQKVTRGQEIGIIETVLKKDKGLPMNMLHLERYVSGTTEPLKEWSLGMSQPTQLLNPTTLLFNAKKE